MTELETRGAETWRDALGLPSGTMAAACNFLAIEEVAP